MDSQRDKDRGRPVRHKQEICKRFGLTNEERRGRDTRGEEKARESALRGGKEW